MVSYQQRSNDNYVLNKGDEMRLKKPKKEDIKVGDYFYAKKFAFLPVEIDGFNIWLEWYWVKMVYTLPHSYGGGKYGIRWDEYYLKDPKI